MNEKYPFIIVLFVRKTQNFISLEKLKESQQFVPVSVFQLRPQEI